MIHRGLLVVSTVLALASASAASAQGNPSRPAAPTQERAVTHRVSGTFEVKLSPQAMEEGEGGSMGRMSLDKQFQGPLQATARGEMLMAGTKTEGSAAYVAIERVTGTLDGRAGSFVLQHYGVMNRGAPSLTITVVPDSGTGQLAGLTGTMTIDVSGGKHAYTMEYTLPAAR